MGAKVCSCVLTMRRILRWHWSGMLFLRLTTGSLRGLRWSKALSYALS